MPPTACSHMFYLGLYRENVKKSSCLKPQAMSLDIWYVASPSEHLQRLFKDQDGSAAGVTKATSTFSEYGHVVYQT